MAHSSSSAPSPVCSCLSASVIYGRNRTNTSPGSPSVLSVHNQAASHPILNALVSPIQSFLHTGSKRSSSSHFPAGSPSMDARGHELTHPPQPSCVLLGPSAGRAWRRTLFSQHPDYGKLSSPLQSLSYWFLSSPLCTVLESGQCLEKKTNQVFESPAFISVCVSLAPWEGTSLSSAAASTGPGLDSGPWKTPEKISHWSPWLSLLHNLVPSCSHCFSCSLGIQMDDKKIYIYFY